MSYRQLGFNTRQRQGFASRNNFMPTEFAVKIFTLTVILYIFISDQTLKFRDASEIMNTLSRIKFIFFLPPTERPKMFLPSMNRISLLRHRKEPFDKSVVYDTFIN